MSTTTTWLVTGASRGLGLGLVTRLVQDPSNVVIAACRTPEKAQSLTDLLATAKGKLHIVKIDVSDASSIRAAYEPVASVVGDKGIDVLYNNAGILLADDTPFSMSADTFHEEFVTNVVGPTLVSQTFLPLVEKSQRKTIVNVSSSLGSIGSVTNPRYSYFAHYTSYSITKTALNMLTYKQAAERPDLTIISLDPGWVKTDLGGSAAPLEVEDSTNGVMNVLNSLKHEDSGSYINYEGIRLPW